MPLPNDIKKIIYITALLTAAAAFFFFSHSSKKNNVLIILIDTLRADHLGCYGYDKKTSPNIDELASQSILYKNCITQGGWTKPAVGSLLTSLYPHNHGAMKFTHKSSDPLPLACETLPEIMQKNGFRTIGLSTNPFITKQNQFDQGFDSFQYLDWKKINASGVVDQFLSTLDSSVPRKPFFAYLHFMDTHMPYRPPEEDYLLFKRTYKGNLSGKKLTFAEEKMLNDENFIPTKDDIEHLISLYDACIHSTDKQLGRLFQELKNRKKYANTMIIFVADHGEEFYEHGGFAHGHSLYNEILKVPLIIKQPHQTTGSVQNNLVRLIDIFPSVLSKFHIRLPDNIIGINIIGKEVPDQEAFTESMSYRSKPLLSLQSARHKIIRKISENVNNIYDLRKDPLEFSPIMDPSLENNLLSALKKEAKKGEVLKEEKNKRLSQDQIKDLKALGYLN